MFPPKNEPKRRISGKAARRPPGPAALPFLGNIHNLNGELHQVLSRLAETHGPVMSLRLGSSTHVVVASTAAAARDVLHRYDHLLAGRSVTDAARALGNHERSILWLPGTSPLWRRLRAVCTNHLFSARGLSATRAVGEEKVRELVRCLSRRAGRVARVVLGSAQPRVQRALLRGHSGPEL